MTWHASVLLGYTRVLLTETLMPSSVSAFASTSITVSQLTLEAMVTGWERKALFCIVSQTPSTWIFFSVLSSSGTLYDVQSLENSSCCGTLDT